MTHTPQEIAEAQRVTDQIKAKVDELLAPLEREMKIMAWRPELRALMYGNVSLEALDRYRKAVSEL